MVIYGKKREEWLYESKWNRQSASYAGENSVSGNGEDIKKKPPMIQWVWCRKPTHRIGGDPNGQ